MSTNISNFFYRISTGWVVLASLMVFLLFIIFALPSQSSGGDQISGEPKIPDLSFYYSADDLYRIAQELGDTGRADYIYARFTFDLVWPLVYAAFLVTSISWIFGRRLSIQGTARFVNLVPFLGMVFDYLENISTSLVMLRFPSNTPLVASLAGLFTLSKWLLIAASFVLLVFGAVVTAWKWIANTRST